MTGKRTYQDGCGLAHALDLVGERWALLIVRELLLGPKRFTDLRAGLPTASSTAIAQRLRDLVASGVVVQRTLPPPAASKVYTLTEWGAELEPIVISLGRWGGRSPSMRHDAPLSVDALVLALRALFDASSAEGMHATLTLVLDEDAFTIRIENGSFEVARGTAGQPDATISTDATTLNRLLWEYFELDNAIRENTVVINGDRRLIERFLELFPLPAPAATA